MKENGSILLAEDNSFILELCDRILRAAGFKTVPVCNGATALELYLANPTDIRLIVADVTMPVMDGIQFIRSVLNVNPNAKIVMMTGHSPNEIIPNDLTGACAILVKPFLPKQLLSAVDECLSPKARGQSA